MISIGITTTRPSIPNSGSFAPANKTISIPNRPSAAATTTVDERINIGLKIASRLKYNGSAHQTQGLKLFTTSEGDCVTFASLFLAAAQLQDFAHYSDGYIVGGNGHAVVQITVGEKGKEFSFYVDNGGMIRDIPNYVSSNIGRKQGRNGELLGTNTGWFFPDSKFKNAQISAKHGGKYNDIPDDHLLFSLFLRYLLLHRHIVMPRIPNAKHAGFRVQ
jgi:hypothetical protein